MADTKVGKVTHVFDKIGVGVVQLTKALKIGDKVKVMGKEGEFEQEVTSMQVDHAPVEKAKPGDDIGMKFDGPVKEGSLVYKA